MLSLHQYCLLECTYSRRICVQILTGYWVFRRKSVHFTMYVETVDSNLRVGRSEVVNLIWSHKQAASGRTLCSVCRTQGAVGDLWKPECLQAKQIHNLPKWLLQPDCFIYEQKCLCYKASSRWPSNGFTFNKRNKRAMAMLKCEADLQLKLCFTYMMLPRTLTSLRGGDNIPSLYFKT